MSSKCFEFKMLWVQNDISLTINVDLMACSNTSLVQLPFLEPALSPKVAPGRQGWLLMDRGTNPHVKPFVKLVIIIFKNLVSEIKCSANEQMNYRATSKCLITLYRSIGPIFIGFRLWDPQAWAFGGFIKLIFGLSSGSKC